MFPVSSPSHLPCCLSAFILPSLTSPIFIPAFFVLLTFPTSARLLSFSPLCHSQSFILSVGGRALFGKTPASDLMERLLWQQTHTQPYPSLFSCIFFFILAIVKPFSRSQNLPQSCSAEVIRFPPEGRWRTLCAHTLCLILSRIHSRAVKCFNNNLINSSSGMWNIYSVEPLAWNVCTSHVFAVSTMGTDTLKPKHTHTQQNEIEGGRRETQGHAGNMRKWSWNTAKNWRMNYGCMLVSHERRFLIELQMFEKEKIHSTPLFWESAVSILR